MKHIPETHLARYVLFCFNYYQTGYNESASGILTMLSDTPIIASRRIKS